MPVSIATCMVKGNRFAKLEQGSTAGLLFNRPNPSKLEYNNKNIKRDGSVDNRNNYCCNQGKDIFSMSIIAPDNSVVNKVGDLKCCKQTLTAAQWIWICNLICFVIHFSMVWTTVYFHHWSSRGEKDLRLKVYRIQVFYNFGNNITIDGGGGRPDPKKFEYTLVDNGMPIDIGIVCCAFYGLSAAFHFLALLMGLLPSFWNYYWKQMVGRPRC